MLSPDVDLCQFLRWIRENVSFLNCLHHNTDLRFPDTGTVANHVGQVKGKIIAKKDGMTRRKLQDWENCSLNPVVSSLKPEMH